MCDLQHYKNDHIDRDAVSIKPFVRVGTFSRLSSSLLKTKAKRSNDGFFIGLFTFNSSEIGRLNRVGRTMLKLSVVLNYRHNYRLLFFCHLCKAHQTKVKNGKIHRFRNP